MFPVEERKWMRDITFVQSDQRRLVINSTSSETQRCISGSGLSNSSPSVLTNWMKHDGSERPTSLPPLPLLLHSSWLSPLITAPPHSVLLLPFRARSCAGSSRGNSDSCSSRGRDGWWWWKKQQILRVSADARILYFGVKLPDLSHIFHNRTISEAPVVSETLHGEFEELLPSGWTFTSVWRLKLLQHSGRVSYLFKISGWFVVVLATYSH